MSFIGVLVDRARIEKLTPTAQKVEGKTVVRRVHTAWFKARLLTQPATQQDDAEGTPRIPMRTTLLVGKKDRDGVPIEVKPGDRIEVDSRQLGRYEWRVTGAPTPYRKKVTLLGAEIPIERIVDETFTPAVP